MRAEENEIARIFCPRPKGRDESFCRLFKLNGVTNIMAEANNKIEDVETVYVAPAGGENVEDPNAQEEDADNGAADNAQADQDDTHEDVADNGAAGKRQPKEKIVTSKPVAPAGKQPENNGEGKSKVGTDGLRDVDGETPRERALRQELAITKAKLRTERGQELGIEHAPAVAPQSQDAPKNADREAALAKKYGPQVLANLREVLPVLADEMGYVKAADLSQQTYARQSQTVLDEFLEAHPEYAAENDKGGVLWSAFKQEYSLYNKPANPKDFAKIFNRIHTAIFGIKPAGSNGAINAAREKINVASHAGASGPSRSNQPARTSAASAAVRLDMLKGFSDEDLEDIASRAAG